MKKEQFESALKNNIPETLRKSKQEPTPAETRKVFLLLLAGFVLVVLLFTPAVGSFFKLLINLL